jgi:hypothetical protein
MKPEDTPISQSANVEKLEADHVEHYEVDRAPSDREASSGYDKKWESRVTRKIDRRLLIIREWFPLASETRRLTRQSVCVTPSA